jgi:hypothetical protein
VIFTIIKDIKDEIFNFAWSKEDKHLALARRQQINNAVQLIAFE